MILPNEDYMSLIQRKKPIVNYEDWLIYDFTAEYGTYFYRDLAKKEDIPFDATQVKKCMARLTNYLATKYNSTSELSKCSEACEELNPYFFVASVLLLEIEHKIELLSDEENYYLALKDRKKPIVGYAPSHEPNLSVLNEYAKVKYNEEAIQNEYKLYRETYGR